MDATNATILIRPRLPTAARVGTLVIWVWKRIIADLRTGSALVIGSFPEKIEGSLTALAIIRKKGWPVGLPMSLFHGYRRSRLARAANR
jgi:hypothetical protein